LNIIGKNLKQKKKKNKSEQHRNIFCLRIWVESN